MRNSADATCPDYAGARGGTGDRFRAGRLDLGDERRGAHRRMPGAGAPGDWQRLTMVVELEKPGDATGGVRYFATDASGKAEPYTPCDTRKPALMLLEARKSQTPERKGWTSARLVLSEDRKLELHYAYPT